MHRLFSSVCLLVVLALSHVNLGWSQGAMILDPPVPKTGSLAHHRVKVPIKVYWGYLVIVQGSIGNLQRLNFLVDTGAYPSVIDRTNPGNVCFFYLHCGARPRQLCGPALLSSTGWGCGLRATVLRPPYGSPTHPIAKANIPRSIWKSFAIVACRPGY
jgi:hypothetical protein